MDAKKSLGRRIRGWLPKQPLQPRRIGITRYRFSLNIILITTLVVSAFAVAYAFYFVTQPPVMPVVDYNPPTTEGLKLHDWIYINPDGPLWPNASAKLLKVEGLVYTFTQNISNSILIQRDGITLDGAGYSLIGPGNTEGIMTLSTNSTVKNVRIVGWEGGIQVLGDYCTISNNYIVANIGLLLRANHLNVTRNVIENIPNGKVAVENPAYERWHYAVYIEPGDAMVVHNNSFSGNQIINFTGAIRMHAVTETTLDNNNIVNNSIGIGMRGCSNNTFYGNNITQCTVFAVSAFRSNNNSFYGNNFINNIKQAVDACSYTLISPEFSSNKWNNNTTGNFWSYYPIEYLNASNPSNIVHVPYELYPNNTDNFPLAVPTFFNSNQTNLWGSP